jgi:iron complex outermembrane receptor protein
LFAIAPAGGIYDGAIEEITVTARRREENVQDVPIAMSVVDGKELEVTGTATLSQLQQLVPNLQVISFNPRNTNVNIRGLGSNIAFANDGLENGVGFYIDQVYYGRLGQSQFDLVDLEQVEVLRGPQGTLFGKNTTAGAVSISTRLPRSNPNSRSAGSAAITADVSCRVGFGTDRCQTSSRGVSVSPTCIATASSKTPRRAVSRCRTTTTRPHAASCSTRHRSAECPADRGLRAARLHCCVNLLDRRSRLTKRRRRSSTTSTIVQHDVPASPPTLDPYDRKTDADSPFAADSSTWGTSGAKRTTRSTTRR